MAIFLRQSTAVTIKLGPFVDDADGKTAETGLTIAQADIRLSKNGGDIAQSNNVAGATHDELGYYDVPLNTTDTNTLGTLRVLVSESGALPVWQDFMVVPANVWDSLFGSDKLQVDSVELSGDSVAADNAESFFDGTGYAGTGNVIPTVTSITNAVTAGTVSDKTGYSLSAGGIQAIWDALTSALTTVGSVGKLIVDNLNATITSRMATFTYTAPPSAAANADAVWDEARADHVAAGSFGEGTASVQGNVTGNVAGNVAGSVASVTAAVTAGTVSDKTGYSLATAPPTAVQVRQEIDANSTKLDAAVSSRMATFTYTAPPSVADILAGVVEGSITVKGALRLALAVLTGKTSGGGTSTIIFRDTGDTKARVTATVDEDGNRGAVVRDITD